MNNKKYFKILIPLLLLIVIIAGISLWKKSSSLSNSEKTSANAQNHEEGSSDTLYTCGMHPNVIQEESGTCPICGMNLTPIKNPNSTPPAKKKRTGKKKIKYWAAPMDPTYIRDEPGKSPMGMDLVPVYEEEEGVASNQASGPVVRINPVVVQNMGVRIKTAELGKVIRNIRTIGEVEVAEDQVSVVNLRFSGWIEKIWADQTGKRVKKGQKLFQIYSQELVSAQEEFLLAVKTQGPSSMLAKSSKKRLQLWEIPDSHIQRVLKTGNGQIRLIVRAPREGYILHKGVVLGNRIEAGKDLYRIGNLTKIWVQTEVYEHDIPWVKLGQNAKMNLTYQSGKVYDGQVSYIYPRLNTKSRTLTVRLEFKNSGLNLKPGMFATVQIQSQTRNNTLIIPSEAIIYSGERKIVFVSTGGGTYEPREVETGLIGDNRVTEILSGISPGEEVVTSGQFLLDSESQLQEAIQKLMATRLQAKIKKTANPTQIQKDNAPKKSKKAKYYTCPMHPQIIQDEPGTCPICGMDLVKKRHESNE